MQAAQRRTTALATVAALAVLLLAAPSPSAALSALRDPSAAGDPTGPLVAAVALLAWALAGWLLLTASLTLLSRVPGGAGRAAQALVHRTAPAAVRQLVGAALGVTVLAGAVAAPAAATSGSDVAVAPSAAASAGAPDLDWPAGGPDSPTTGAEQATPDLDWPITPADELSPQAAPDLDWPVAPGGAAPGEQPAPDLDWPAVQAPAPVLGAATSTGAAADAVVVQPGDTLWSVAEDALAQAAGRSPDDAEVAAAWPAWWSANREVVGDDPDLLLPGTALRPPPADAD